MIVGDWGKRGWREEYLDGGAGTGAEEEAPWFEEEEEEDDDEKKHKEKDHSHNGL